ncbi:maleylpyruvate isomerase N-terminal domain-containing protein [Streptomyces sp. NPDC048665]|uniref:maleylpyruvate isomerase N-terminal domain-containing protein n=1 Tax=Streptomyces sp. NPDC048665 TaxID=3155490 RepID=UPI0034421F6D
MIMDLSRVLDAFETEAEALGRGLAGLPEVAWDRPTRCSPWSAHELLGHVCVVLDWVPDMIDGQAPEVPEVSATEYYSRTAASAPRPTRPESSLDETEPLVIVQGPSSSPTSPKPGGRRKSCAGRSRSTEWCGHDTATPCCSPTSC